MRLQTKSLPNPADRHPTEPCGFGQTSCAPMGFAARRTFQSLNDDVFQLGIAHLTRRSGSRFIIAPASTPELKPSSRTSVPDNQPRLCFLNFLTMSNE